MSALTKEIFSGPGQRQLLEQLPQVTYLLDMETGECLFVNDRFFELLGYENRGQSQPASLFNELLLPADKELFPFTREDRNTINDGGFVPVEYRFYHRDRKVITMAGRNTRFTFPESGTTCVLGNIMDITEQKQKELSLRTNHEAYEYAVQHSEIAISVLDKKGHFVHVNPKFSEIYGYRYKEIIGEHFTVLAPNEDRKSLWNEIFDEILDSEGVYDGEWVMATKTGEMLTVTSRNYHLDNNEGRRQVIQFLRII
ncbi:PAS domain-containing protein [Roseivirga sp. BDSF3-8]|uniref:PAS domain-containing protein n=1 Tax=Roseivirga sp. BDSF3-8 TaxID=3241598 RepID=UPI003531D644